MNLSKMSGTPWHIGFLKKDEDDTRRHKARCAYYEKGHCSTRFSGCIGSAHCSQYREK